MGSKLGLNTRRPTQTCPQAIKGVPRQADVVKATSLPKQPIIAPIDSPLLSHSIFPFLARVKDLCVGWIHVGQAWRTMCINIDHSLLNPLWLNFSFEPIFASSSHALPIGPPFCSWMSAPDPVLINLVLCYSIRYHIVTFLLLVLVNHPNRSSS